MRLNLLRIFSYIVLILIIAGAILFQGFADTWLSKAPEHEAESVPVKNTIVILNELNEKHLLARMNELDRQRASLQQQLQNDNSDEINAELQRSLQLLQDEKSRLEGEITYVRQEAVQLKDESADEAVNEEMFKELADTRKQLNNSLKTNRSLNSEIADLRRELERQAEAVQTSEELRSQDTDGLKSRIDNLRAEVVSLQSKAESDGREISGLNSKITALTDEVEHKNDLLQAQESERLQKELEYEQQLTELRRQLQRLEELEAANTAAGLSEAAAAREELEKIIDKLFAASDIRGIFVRTGTGGANGIRANEARISEAVDSPFVSVYRNGGGEISKIVLSEKDGEYEYRIFPGYPEPEEGDWF